MSARRLTTDDGLLVADHVVERSRPVDTFWRTIEPMTAPSGASKVSSTPRSVPSAGQPRPLADSAKRCAVIAGSVRPALPATEPLFSTHFTVNGAAALLVLVRLMVAFWPETLVVSAKEDFSTRPSRTKVPAVTAGTSGNGTLATGPGATSAVKVCAAMATVLFAGTWKHNEPSTMFWIAGSMKLTPVAVREVPETFPGQPGPALLNVRPVGPGRSGTAADRSRPARVTAVPAPRKSANATGSPSGCLALPGLKLSLPISTDAAPPVNLVYGGDAATIAVFLFWVAVSDTPLAKLMIVPESPASCPVPATAAPAVSNRRYVASIGALAVGTRPLTSVKATLASWATPTVAVIWKMTTVPPAAPPEERVMSPAATPGTTRFAAVIPPAPIFEFVKS